MEITQESRGLPVCRLGELEEPAAEARWLIESLWGRAAVGFVAGHPKVGKTWLGLDLALSVATGTRCLDRFEVQDPGPVLVYLAEDHPHTVRERLAGLCKLRGLRIEEVALHVITAPAVRLDIERDRVRLMETVAAIRPRLLLLDPLVRLHRRDENHAGEVAELLTYLRDLQRLQDLAVIVVHHLRKNGGGRAGQALRGSGDFHAWIDSGLYLRYLRDQLLLSAEHRHAPGLDGIELRLVASEADTTHLEIVDSGDNAAVVRPEAGSTSGRVIELLASAPRPLTRVELRRRLRINNQKLGAALEELQEQSRISRSQQGWLLLDGKDEISKSIAEG